MIFKRKKKKKKEKKEFMIKILLRNGRWLFIDRKGIKEAKIRKQINDLKRGRKFYNLTNGWILNKEIVVVFYNEKEN